MYTKDAAHILLLDSANCDQFLGVVTLDLDLDEWVMVLARGADRFSRVGGFQTMDQLVAHAAFILGMDVIAAAVPNVSDDPYGQLSDDKVRELLENNKYVIDHRHNTQLFMRPDDPELSWSGVFAVSEAFTYAVTTMRRLSDISRM